MIQTGSYIETDVRIMNLHFIIELQKTCAMRYKMPTKTLNLFQCIANCYCVIILPRENNLYLARP